ncbi:thermonuclease family protein [Rhizobium sp. Leaf383]|uniref:thermonuclease family protein n=1 Tax=Rhizobium sp. Leaf383 TaxID=1736357 RepID=UPI0009E9FE4C|nr:thermonuclease family protein [Rhizobium sp. Leaf383]
MGTQVKTRATIVSILLCIASGAYAETIEGRASVIDGDTIDIQGRRIRFNGIDAPETRQLCSAKDGVEYHCGRVSADALDHYLAASRPTRCETHNRDRYKRYVADCYRADGQSVSSWMVRTGLALDWPRYSKGAFAADQAAAKASQLGIWQGTFILPWDWRKR